MSEDAWPKLGASMGIVAAALLILSFLFGPGEPPGFDETAGQVQSFLQEERGAVQAAVAFQFAALVTFAWFLGSVFYRLRDAEPGGARLSAAALVGGVLVAAGGLVGSAGGGAAVYHVDTLGADAVLALWDLSVFGFLFFLAGFTVLAGATGALALRSGALPALLGGYSVLAGAYALIVGVVGAFSETGAFSPSDGALGLIAFLLFLVWLLAMGLVLAREPRGTSPPAPA
jgi:hypothetical protein